MLACCDLLKDENTDEVNFEADFHFQVFHQKGIIHKHIKLCASAVVVVYLTFCQQVAHFLVMRSSSVSIHDHSTFSYHYKVLSASYLLLASHAHIYTQVTYVLLESSS